jgi:hypothetical protein
MAMREDNGFKDTRTRKDNTMNSEPVSTLRTLHVKIATAALVISAFAVGVTLSHPTQDSFESPPTSHLTAAPAHLLPKYIHHADGNAPGGTAQVATLI